LFLPVRERHRILPYLTIDAADFFLFERIFFSQAAIPRAMGLPFLAGKLILTLVHYIIGEDLDKFQNKTKTKTKRKVKYTKCYANSLSLISYL